MHLSFGHQVADAATRHARGTDDLVLLVIDGGALAGGLVVEHGFPHLYAPLPVEAVTLVADFPPEADGAFLVPDTVREQVVQGPQTLDDAVSHVRSLMAGCPARWWIGGGWAVDGWLGAVGRSHHDIDLIVLRADQHAVFDHLRAWEVRLVGEGRWERWDAPPLPDEVNQVWARRADELDLRWQEFSMDPSFVEVLFEVTDGDDWVYRRHPAVREPLARLGAPGGFLDHRIALLYKAGASVPTARNAADWERALLRLSEADRAWLHGALALAHPASPLLPLLGD